MTGLTPPDFKPNQPPPTDPFTTFYTDRMKPINIGDSPNWMKFPPEARNSPLIESQWRDLVAQHSSPVSPMSTDAIASFFEGKSFNGFGDGNDIYTKAQVSKSRDGMVIVNCESLPFQTEHGPVSKTMIIAYDKNGRIIQIRKSSSTTEFIYDRNGYLISQKLYPVDQTGRTDLDHYEEDVITYSSSKDGMTPSVLTKTWVPQDGIKSITSVNLQDYQGWVSGSQQVELSQ